MPAWRPRMLQSSPATTPQMTAAMIIFDLPFSRWAVPLVKADGIGGSDGHVGLDALALVHGGVREDPQDAARCRDDPGGPVRDQPGDDVAVAGAARHLARLRPVESDLPAPV